MNWAMQAVHVARKDARQARVALGIYAVVVAITLYGALAQPVAVNRSSWFDITPFVMMVFGVILTASAVQADSPTESSAFWASRPFHPTAMLGGKLVFAIVTIVGIPLVAQLIGLVLFQAPSGVIAESMARSFAFYGILLVAAIVVAALTRDVRGFIVATLALLVGMATVIALFTTSTTDRVVDVSTKPWVETLMSFAIDVVSIGGGIALLAWLYRRRDVSRVAWIGAVIVVAACLGLLAKVDESHAAIDGATSIEPQITIDRFTFGEVRSKAGPALSIRFNAAPSARMHRLSLHVATVRVRLRDGSVIAAVPAYGTIDLSDAAAALPAGIQPVDANESARGIAVTFRDEDQPKLSSEAIAGIDVEGRAMVAEAVPLIAGTFGGAASVTAHGTRVRIGPAAGVANSVIEVSTASVGVRTEFSDPAISAVIVNEQRREGVTLHAREYGMGSSWIVLPGAPMWTSRLRFDATRPNDNSNTETMVVAVPGVGGVSETRTTASHQGQLPPPPWYTGAKLIVVRWTHASSQNVHLSKTVP